MSLVEQIREAGKKVNDPPSSVDELLTLLDDVLNCLSKFDSMKAEALDPEALDPLKRAFLHRKHRKIYRHSGVDVKVAVAACISEITRITRPKVPYNNRKMKEAFKLIVSIFEEPLVTPSYHKTFSSLSKKILILENLFKVRACIVMIDLCKGLIDEMFENFLEAISDHCPPEVFSAMENVMTLVLEEISYIPSTMLAPILRCVRKDIEVPKASRRLAKRVLSNCATTLKMYLPTLVGYFGLSSENYSKIVGVICNRDSQLGCCCNENEKDIKGHLTKKEAKVKEDYRRYSRRGSGIYDEINLFRKIMDEILETGDKLFNPPSSVKKLLTLLERCLACLKTVKHWPPKTKNEALNVFKNVLFQQKLTMHSEVDVKVAVAACISEITRMSAPNAPYKDRNMREAFKFIVSTFEEPLGCKSTPSTETMSKKTLILESLANVSVCVVMVDLKCDELIIEMFETFLKAICNRYPRNVFPSMVKIMTFVLEKSDVIRPEMLSPILGYVKEGVEVPLVSRRLAEKVLSNCASRLKTYLPEAVRLSGGFDIYSKKVALICSGNENEVKDSKKRKRKRIKSSKPNEESNKILQA